MKITRRSLVAAAAAAKLARPAIAAPKPDKLVFMIDNAPWHGTMTEDAAPAFEKETGIHIEFTVLPDDALTARLKAELSAQSSTIDITQFGTTWVSWLSPHLWEAETLLANATGRYAENFAFDDFSPAVRKMGTHEGKLYGVPYRVTMGVLHYQPEVLKQAGIAQVPTTWKELRDAALAITRAGEGKRFGIGVPLRQGPAITDHWVTFLRSNGGDFYDEKTHEIFINRPEAIESLAFYGALATKDKVIPPDAVTWEWDEIIANGQNDRYGMGLTFGPSGTLLNDPRKSKTGGRWAAAVVPGARSLDQSRTFLGGWCLGVPRYSKNREWAFAFLQMVASREWAKRSMEKGNATARISVLADPEIGQKYQWAAAAAKALETAQVDPQDALWGALNLPLRLGISRVVTGETDAKTALDTVATNWQRIMKRGAAL